MDVLQQCSKLFDEVKHLKLSRGRPKFIPDDFVEQIMSLERQGKTIPEIAESLGFSVAQIHNTITREKLTDTTMRFMSSQGDAEFIKEMLVELRSEKNWKATGLTKQKSEIMLNQHAVESLYSATYVEDYLDSMENLPDDVMKQLTKMKEMDVHFQKYLNDLESQMKILLDSQDPKKESNSKLRLQNVLISAQDKGDEKLQIVQQVQDFVDNKVRQLELDEKNLDVFVTDFGKDVDHDSRIDSKNMEHSDRPLKRARRARHEVYVPSILGPSTLEATSFSDALNPVVESHPHHHPSNTKSVPGQSSSAHNISSHTTSTNHAFPSVVVSTSTPSTNVSHSTSNVQPSHETRETTGTSSKSTSNVNTPVEEKSSYTPSSQSSVTTNATTSSLLSTPKKRDQQKKEVQEKKHKRRKTKQSDNSPPPNIPIDPDEPTYCLCDQVSYGEMIGCDNDLCPIEWFHFSCVQLTTKPKGKWYCPKCRGDRPNVPKPKAMFLKELEKYNREKEKS